MAVEIRVQVTDPPSDMRKLATQLQQMAPRQNEAPSRVSTMQERLLEHLVTQQDRLLDALHRLSAAKPSPPPDLSGLLKVLDQQWGELLRVMKDVRPTPTIETPIPLAVHERFDRLEEAMGKSMMTASPDLLHRFDAMTEAIRRMRPKTYGIMRG